MSLAVSAARIAAFFLCFTFLQLGWQGLHDGPVHAWVVQDGLLRPAAAILNLFQPDLGVTVQGTTLRGSSGGGLHIVNGCEGVEAHFLFLSALLVAPRRGRCLGCAIVSGTLVLQVLNILRVVGLFAAFRHNPALFAQLHALVMPLVTVLVAAACALACLPRPEARLASP